MNNRYEVRGDITAIFIERKDGSVFETLIDTEDLARYLKLNRRLYVDALRTGHYVKYHVNRTRKRMFHRFILDAPDDLFVDHINHNPLDNRKSNIRLATNAQNLQNLKSARRDSLSGIRGVSKKGTKWRARAYLNGKEYSLGYFLTPEEASLSAKNFRKKHMPYSLEADEIRGCPFLMERR